METIFQIAKGTYLGIILAVATLSLFCPTSVFADDPLPENLASGYIPLDVNEFNSLPKLPRYRSFLPESIDLSASFPTPGNQETLGSCVAWAVGYGARSYYAHTTEGRKRNSPKDIPSPSFIYNLVRDPKDCKSGTNFPAAFKLLEKGSLSLADYPYRATCTLPNEQLQLQAADFKIDGWLAVKPSVIDDIKGELSRGNPVMFGIMADKRLQSLGKGQIYAKNEVSSTPFPHALTAVGYDDRRQALKFINSWGTRWGDHGFGWMSYDTFTRYAGEAYVMLVKNKLPEPDPKPVVVVAEPPQPNPVPVKIVAQPPVSKPEPKPLTPVEPTTRIDAKPRIVVPPAPPVIVVPPTPPVIVVPPDPPVIVAPVSSSDCSKVVTNQTDNRTILSGFVGSEIALEQLQKTHQGANYQFEVELRPWPQCEVLMTLDVALHNSGKPQLSFIDNRSSFKTSEAMVLKVKAPNKPSYLYITYVQADGSVINLQQPAIPVAAPSLSGESYVFGDGLEGRQKFVASAPFGREMVVVISSASPLFGAALPSKQTEREYLSLLRKAIIYKADPKVPDREISATFLGIETREK